MIQQIRDKDGYYWIVPEDAKQFEQVNVWWSRQTKKNAQGKKDHLEVLIIHQENSEDRADVLTLSLGQVYDLIKVLNDAVEKT